MKNSFLLLKDKARKLSIDYEKLVYEIILYSQNEIRIDNNLNDTLQKIATLVHLLPPKLSRTYTDRIIAEIEILEQKHLDENKELTKDDFNNLKHIIDSSLELLDEDYFKKISLNKK